MKPGRELDALVAEYVMNWPTMHPLSRLRPLYSTDIAAAWAVLEKLRSLGFNVELQGDADGWECLFLDYPEIGRCEGDTAPFIICLAALEAVGVEVGDD